MDYFLNNIGFLTIVILIIYIIKKIYDYVYFSQIERERADSRINRLGEGSKQDYVYKAAEAYALGAGVSEVQNILSDSIDLDEEDINEIISLLNRSNSSDSGYDSFIKAVNKVLGEDAYIIRSKKGKE